MPTNTRRFIDFQKPYSSLPFAIRWRSAYVERNIFSARTAPTFLIVAQDCNLVLSTRPPYDSHDPRTLFPSGILLPSKFNFFPRVLLTSFTEPSTDLQLIVKKTHCRKKNIATL